MIRVYSLPLFIPPKSSFIVLISFSFQLNAHEYSRQCGQLCIESYVGKRKGVAIFIGKKPTHAPGGVLVY